MSESRISELIERMRSLIDTARTGTFILVDVIKGLKEINKLETEEEEKVREILERAFEFVDYHYVQFTEKALLEVFYEMSETLAELEEVLEELLDTESECS